MQISMPVLNWEGLVHVSISVAQISIIFRGKEITDIMTFKNHAQSIAQDLVDALGYSWGRGYAVEITSLTDPLGRHYVFGVGVPVIEDNPKDRPVTPLTAVELALSNPWLRRAFADLRGAIREPSDTGFYCMRAAESIRQHFKALTQAGNGWDELRSALNIRESTLKSLREFGTPQRHGEIAVMSDAERARDMSLAWKVVDRFVALLDRSLTTLPAVEFPLL
jgi:hypothetical protein